MGGRGWGRGDEWVGAGQEWLVRSDFHVVQSSVLRSLNPGQAISQRLQNHSLSCPVGSKAFTCKAMAPFLAGRINRTGLRLSACACPPDSIGGSVKKSTPDMLVKSRHPGPVSSTG
ncbi:MAG: hypothetical protein JW932_16410 [Deltaproteobacteria bacterium]|nr:hypothetical protein [Deltaproteobacteria bacterium]